MKAALLTVLLLPALGCGRLFFEVQEDGPAGPGVDADVSPDDFVGSGPFSAPVPVEGLDPLLHYDDPALTSDMQEMYFNRSDLDLMLSFRQPDGSWSEAVEAPVLNDGFNAKSNTAMSGDGKTMLFGRFESDWDIYMSTRPSRGNPWSPSVIVPELSTGRRDLLGGLSPNGNRLIFHRDFGPSNLFEAWRSGPEDAWQVREIVELNALGDSFGGHITNDGLTIIFTLGEDLHVSTRAAADQDFSAPKSLTELNEPGSLSQDPWLTPDGKTIVFASNRAGIPRLYMATR